jgi:uncharacterized protein
MKILALSDNELGVMENAENLRKVYSDTTIVMSCGDMPASYLDFISSILGKPLFYVRGNHDIYYDENEGVPGGENLHGRVVQYQGVTFAGLEGCIRYNKEPIQYTELEMRTLVLKLYPQVLLYRARTGRNLDVLVTHSPVRDVHDMMDRPHRGFKCFHMALRLFKPRLMIHGHVDTQDARRVTETVLYGTRIVNINPMKYFDLEKGP